MRRYFSAFNARTRPPDNQLLEPAVEPEGDDLRDLLAHTPPDRLSADQVNARLEGKLWMLTPESFLYFLPAFLSLVEEHYGSLSCFAAELVSALTEPRREDILESLNRVEQIPPDMGLKPDILTLLRQQQLEWFDSGQPFSTYERWVSSVSAEESEAILHFLATMRDAHSNDFPFHEPAIAFDRYMARKQ